MALMGGSVIPRTRSVVGLLDGGAVEVYQQLLWEGKEVKPSLGLLHLVGDVGRPGEV